MEKYTDDPKQMICVFVDLQKVYDRVPREDGWYCTRKSGWAENYARIAQYMYEDRITTVRCAAGVAKGIEVKVGLH